MIKKKNSFIISLIALFASLLFMAGVLYAWFAFNDKINSGLETSIVDFPNNGYALASVNDEKTAQDLYFLQPGDKLELKISVVADNEDFGIVMAAKFRSYDDFKTFFTMRNDLILGQYKYQKASSIVDIDGKPIPLGFYDFDVVKYLANRTPSLTGAEIKTGQVDFLYKFATPENIHSTFNLTITHIDGEEVAPQDGKLTRIIETGSFAETYYPPAPMSFVKGQELMVLLEYGGNGNLPKAQISAGETAPSGGVTLFEPGEYVALNYNCFIGMNLEVSFQNVRPNINP